MKKAITNSFTASQTLPPVSSPPFNKNMNKKIDKEELRKTIDKIDFDEEFPLILGEEEGAFEQGLREGFDDFKEILKEKLFKTPHPER